MFKLDGVDRDDSIGVGQRDEQAKTESDAGSSGSGSGQQCELQDLEDDEEDEDESDENSSSGESDLEVIESQPAPSYCVKQLSLPIHCADKQRAYNNIRELDVLKKSSLVYLIERNRERNHICCPFDELAFVCFDTSAAAAVPVTTSPTRTSRHAELVHVRPTLLKQLDGLHLTSFSTTDVNLSLLPNCVSSLCMPFFFDIIQASDLRLFSATKCEILRSLRRSHVPQHFLVDNASLVKYLSENVLWNCFALFNYKFSPSFRIGFINFLISLFCLIEHFQLKANDESTKRIAFDEWQVANEYVKQLKQAVPCYIEALVLNGFLTEREMKTFAQFHTEQDRVSITPTEQNEISSYGSVRFESGSVNAASSVASSYSLLAMSASLETASGLTRQRIAQVLSRTEGHRMDYLSLVDQTFNQVRENYFPLNLKSLCRIAIKNQMKEFGVQHVSSKLPMLSEQLKSYMMFDDEFLAQYQDNKSFLKASGDWF